MEIESGPDFPIPILAENPVLRRLPAFQGHCLVETDFEQPAFQGFGSGGVSLFQDSLKGILQGFVGEFPVSQETDQEQQDFGGMRVVQRLNVVRREPKCGRAWDFGRPITRRASTRIVRGFRTWGRRRVQGRFSQTLAGYLPDA
jgi:hypothetical protein